MFEVDGAVSIDNTVFEVDGAVSVDNAVFEVDGAVSGVTTLCSKFMEQCPQ